MASSNDVQRLFLQAVLSRRIVSYKLACAIWKKCAEATVEVAIPRDDDRAAWDGFITKINESLNALNLEFRHLTDEISGRETYALVNRKGDEIAQMATDYTPAEIVYFKAIVEQIMLAPHESFSVSSLAALRELSYLKSTMTKTQGETVLGSFVAKGWLVKSDRGRYSLSTRTRLELLPYIKSTYPDEMIECTICMEILTRGIACYTRNCKARLHTHCYNNYRRLHQNCPACGQNWTAEANAKKLVQVGEGAVKDGQDDGRRRVRRKSTAEGSDDEDAEGDPDSSQQTQSQTQPSQSQKKGKGKTKANRRTRKTIVEDDEDEEEEETNENAMDVDEDDNPPPRTQSRRKTKN
ncbi:hypothetical protein JAAARDRAFT_708550 [Jaapia argillacea MUCL 33604]|uniref:Non-structural maintenance of chromosomes element 1 homolog n=1 Tax=Jaapia argillacea MUCL 33604 TaxID=933084 RepID=A0A067Q3G1_9AGAM|nr:hypothetical protein JAAARDRAFT_708550 [Jaapia argillacea MUCL 33604]